MKLIKKIVLIIIALLVVLVPLGISLSIGWRPFLGPATRELTDRKFEPTPARMERGRYLVMGVTGCLGCHSERDTSAGSDLPKPGREGSGGLFVEDPGLGKVYASNISSDKETGVGNWTDDQLARAIREGIGGDGRALFPIMPYQNYRHMSDEDLASVIVYIRSLAPIRNAVPKTQIHFPINRLIMTIPAPVTEPVSDPDISTPKARGEHLVTLASCGDCHTPQDSQGQRIESLRFGGGMVLDGISVKKIAAANLTPDPSGIPYYDEPTFIQTLRTGQLGARKIDAAMPWNYYRNMTDDDLKAVYAYIHTLPPVKHSVDNSVEPTMCPLCGHTHGLGSRNKK